jgi:hypothetical protein
MTDFFDKDLKQELIPSYEKSLLKIFDFEGKCLHNARQWENGICMCRVCGKDVTPQKKMKG